MDDIFSGSIYHLLETYFRGLLFFFWLNEAGPRRGSRQLYILNLVPEGQEWFKTFWYGLSAIFREVLSSLWCLSYHI